MNIANNTVKNMLANIQDPKLRSVYGSIASGKISALVHCLSDNCKGRVIAHITAQGRVEELAPVAQKVPKKGVPIAQKLYSSGLEGHRQRFDGQWGFRCYCGNNSILCKEERGVITPARPSEADLLTIATRLEKRRGDQYPAKAGKKEVDGFLIEEVKA